MFRKLLFVLGLVSVVALGDVGVNYLTAANNPSNEVVVSSVTQLRSTPANQYQQAYLTQYNSTTNKGSGHFVYSGSQACTDDSGTLFQSSVNGTNTGCWVRKTDGRPYDPTWFGAECGGVEIFDGVSNSSSAVITSSSAKFTAKMANEHWIAVVNTAAGSNKQLRTTVSGFNSSTSITLATTAGSSNTAETVYLYPDDYTPFASLATVSAASSAGVTMPTGQICGVNGSSANPFLRFYSSFYLNNATLWLSQTGPDNTYGESLVFGVTNTGFTLVGPGVIDGEYQTNQGISQSGIPGVQFDTGSNNGGIIGNVTIQNTKGRCVSGGGGVNFTITDLLIQNCGDFVYDNSGNPNDQTGRSMGIQLDGYDGNVTIKGFTSVRAAQSAILISGFGSEPVSLHVAISHCKLSYSGYFNFDFELNNGTIDISDCQSYSQGGVPSGGILYGGFISRDTKYLHVSNYTGIGTDGSAFIVLNTDVDANLIDMSLDDVNIIGSSTNHRGQISISAGFFSGTEGHQYLNLHNVRYDNLTFSSAPAPTCSTSQPFQQLFQFDGLRANQVASQGSGVSETNFNPQANNGTLVYLLGRNSSLGTVNINTAVNYTKGQYFDWSGVLTNGVLTFTGSASSSISSGSIKTLPGNNSPGDHSFDCTTL